MSELGETLIEDARRRLADGYPRQIRAALEPLSDDQVWGRPNPAANSIGNLVLHLAGASRHFLGRGVGGGNYVRDRPGEFADEGRRPRAELLAALDEAADEADRVLGALDPGKLMEITDKAGEPHTVFALVQRVAHHWSVHTGQIVYAAKALREGALDEIWRRTMS